MVGHVALRNQPIAILNVLKDPLYKEKDLAKKEGDVTTAFMFKEILEDEEEHHDLFTTMLEEV